MVFRLLSRYFRIAIKWLAVIFLGLTVFNFLVGSIDLFKKNDLAQRHQMEKDHIKKISKIKVTTGKVCPEIPPNLIGKLNMTLEEPTFEEIAKRNPLLGPGGYYRPLNCFSRHGPTVFVIPYRNRESQLRTFLNHMHPILQRQQLEYMIVVAEQSGNNTFNRGMLMNIGYNESLGLLPFHREFQCTIFHDVDLLPENDTATFTCKDHGVHFSGFLKNHGYRIIWPKLFGGASCIPRWVFQLMNGYSNMYFGWGGEDDDVRKRLDINNFNFTRPPKEKLTYRMIVHRHEASNKPNPNRLKLLKGIEARAPYDGLNSLTYRVLKKELLPTHVRVLVEVNQTEVETAVVRHEQLLKNH